MSRSNTKVRHLPLAHGWRPLTTYPGGFVLLQAEGPDGEDVTDIGILRLDNQWQRRYGTTLAGVRYWQPLPEVIG